MSGVSIMVSGPWEPNKEEVEKAIKRMNAAWDHYERIYGEHSLDRVIIHDPTWMDADNFNRGAEKLESAIKNNRPLEQIPEEMWHKVVF